MINKKHQQAYFQGLDDAKSGTNFRLEITEDLEEYEFYIKGRKAGSQEKELDVSRNQVHTSTTWTPKN